jgi:SAM-dependent methyltransferase
MAKTGKVNTFWSSSVSREGKTMDGVLCSLKPYIQPFERRLALAELTALANSEPVPFSSPRRSTHPRNGNGLPHQFLIRSGVDPLLLVERLAYWETVEGTGLIPTRQVLREATSNGNSSNGFAIQPSLDLDGQADLSYFPQRRCLRYGSHGLHEYRGKFFPQLVRSLLNMAGASPSAKVLDPMCGSGTTLVEAVLAGCQGYGLDMNPLSTFMSRAKCAILSIEPSQIERSVKHFLAYLVSHPPLEDGRYLSRLSDEDLQYLHRWFSSRTLQSLDVIMTHILSLRSPVLRDFYRLVVSNVLRSVSWQKEDDLRVRKEVPEEETDAFEVVSDELERVMPPLLKFLRQERDRRWKHGDFSINEGDARTAHEQYPGLIGKVDVVITSPPYATALPYIDTDRLSLIFLSLLPREDHRSREQTMIGNREISTRLREAYWNNFQQKRPDLPSEITRLVEHIERLNRNADVGFRRKNLAPLLAKYFLDMKTVFASIRELLRPGGRAYVVIGSNRTIAGGEEVEIRTPCLLNLLAEQVGFEVRERISMEMLVSRDIFRKNAIPTEEILELVAPDHT